MDSPDCAPFVIGVRTRAGAVVLALSGDFDISVVHRFRACVEDVIASADGGVVVDLCDVTFIDSTAISALLIARQHLAARHRELRLQHTASVSRIFKLAGLADLLDEIPYSAKRPSPN
jgi:anti-sigma B factor antagonist